MVKKPARPRKSKVSPATVLTFVPVCTQKRYAELTGLDDGIVRGQVDKGLLPTRKVGRHRMINLARLQKACLEADQDA